MGHLNVSKPRKLHEPQQDSLNITVTKRKKSLNAHVTVHYFMDGGQHIAYMPAFNLTAYGDTREEAVTRLNRVVVKDFCEELSKLSLDKISNELKKLGWSKNKIFQRRFSNSYVDREGVLRNFDLPEETPIQTIVVSV